ncbi:hypothetical protein [Psittacicella hinzii]|uniref:Uncharacterized protein n=1 Tax=Psittacicella hinzii TaxID=2028575 RepID=A0A3A1YG29_9GAMM|nr:hypothetical protein [Psittacicella hinzii]RIY37092.1 hypothetical protein CKF58_05370 [Psittacicella hinzii]
MQTKYTSHTYRRAFLACFILFTAVFTSSLNAANALARQHASHSISYLQHKAQHLAVVSQLTQQDEHANHSLIHLVLQPQISKQPNLAFTKRNLLAHSIYIAAP